MAKVKLRATKDDVAKSGDQGDLEVAPIGLYTGELIEVNAGYSKGDDDQEDKSRPRLETIYKLTGVGREGAPLPSQYGWLWDYVSFSEDSGWKRAQFGLAMGLKVNAKGDIEGDIEIEPNKPGTVIGTPVLIRVKHQKNRETKEMRAKVGWVGHINSSEAGSETSDAFADDGAVEEEANPFGADSGGGEEESEELLTREGLEAITDMKELGAIASEFDLDPADFIVRDSKKQVDLDGTKAAVISAILDAQGGEPEAAEGETNDSPF